jgi:hypothetical protein
MQLTMVLQILGYDVSVGIGTDISKSDPEEPKEVVVIESSADTQIAMGFQRNPIPDDEDWEEDRAIR